jgi:HD-GYP domain-containing protein (c-di-GMP phosphodiesterase class II)/pSer/pThr/pTyr-binding forkhead associated (FHA) protein
MAFIRIKTGPNKGKQFDIKDQPLTVGREENQIIQILDQGVSRAHAEIFRMGEMCFVRDLNSTNGTFVNDVKITEELLKAGDELLIGTTILLFVDTQPGVAAGTAEGVEFEGEAEAKIETTTVELRVDPSPARQGERAVGREIQSRNLTLLSQIGRILRAEKDLPRVLEKAVEVLCTATASNQGYFFAFDPEGGKPVPRVVIESEDSGADKKVSRTITNRVKESRMPLLTTDATLDGRFSLSESIILKKIKSVICVPVLVDDQVKGLLYFHSNKVDHTLTVEDLELVASVALQLSTALAAEGTSEQVRKSLLGTIQSLVSAMELMDKSVGHAQRVSDYSGAVAIQMGFPSDEIHRIRLAALLHDVGKLAVLAQTPGATPEQVRELHVAAGEQLLTGIEGFESILSGIRYHHERADGSGFPYKLKNAEIPQMARIIIVANAFDNACTSGGPGGAPLPSKDVVKDMAQRGGKDFDEEVIKALILCHRNGALYHAAPVPPPTD